jgi:hypothetical protein
VNFNTIAFSAFVAFGFVAWGMVGNRLGVSGPWLASLVYISATFSILSLNFKPLIKTGSWPGILIVLAILLTGFFNGLSSKLYGDKMASHTIDPAVLTTLVFIFMIIETPIFNLILNQKIPTLNHCVAFALAVGAVYFLNK